MTVITISTIGFTEVIDLSGNPGGRVFTIFIAISGIGAMMYVVTNFIGLVVEGELTESFRKRKRGFAPLELPPKGSNPLSPILSCQINFLHSFFELRLKPYYTSSPGQSSFS